MFQPHSGALFNQRMIQRNTRRVETQRTRRDLRDNVVPDDAQRFLVGVQLIGPHVYHKGAAVRHHIVLRTCLNLGDGDVYFT